MKLQKQKIVFLFLFLLIVASTPFFGKLRTKYFSAYGSCRNMAMQTKGFDVWKHENTRQKFLVSDITFSDGTNELICHTFGIGPFWYVSYSMQSLAGCAYGLNNINAGKPCPEGYFGVSP